MKLNEQWSIGVGGFTVDGVGRQVVRAVETRLIQRGDPLR